jgi:hypothetical protein
MSVGSARWLREVTSPAGVLWGRGPIRWAGIATSALCSDAWGAERCHRVASLANVVLNTVPVLERNEGKDLHFG